MSLDLSLDDLLHISPGPEIDYSSISVEGLDPDIPVEELDLGEATIVLPKDLSVVTEEDRASTHSEDSVEITVAVPPGFSQVLFNLEENSRNKKPKYKKISEYCLILCLQRHKILITPTDLDHV